MNARTFTVAERELPLTASEFGYGFAYYVGTMLESEPGIPERDEHGDIMFRQLTGDVLCPHCASLPAADVPMQPDEAFYTTLEINGEFDPADTLCSHCGTRFDQL